MDARPHWSSVPAEKTNELYYPSALIRSMWRVTYRSTRSWLEYCFYKCYHLSDCYIYIWRSDEATTYGSNHHNRWLFNRYRVFTINMMTDWRFNNSICVPFISPVKPALRVNDITRHFQGPPRVLGYDASTLPNTVILDVTVRNPSSEPYGTLSRW